MNYLIILATVIGTLSARADLQSEYQSQRARTTQPMALSTVYDSAVQKAHDDIEAKSDAQLAIEEDAKYKEAKAEIAKRFLKQLKKQHITRSEIVKMEAVPDNQIGMNGSLGGLQTKIWYVETTGRICDLSLTDGWTGFFGEFHADDISCQPLN